MNVTIDCDDCRLQNSDACKDCVVSFITNRDPEEAVVLNIGDFDRLNRLESAGLVPGIKYAN